MNGTITTTSNDEWVIVIRGVQAPTPAALELAKARIRTALKLPHTGTATIREWLFDDITKGRA